MQDGLILAGLLVLGLVVGVYGTIIGAGGGFVLTPLLLMLYGDKGAEEITAISLAVVFANAVSGTQAFARQRRIDYGAALLFALATLPGAVIGALATGLLPRRLFEALFAALLLSVAVVLFARPAPRTVRARRERRHLLRVHTDASGDTYQYSYDPVLGAGLGLVVGFTSSLFGVGGGIIYVPAMVILLRFPVYLATATSTFILMFTAAAGALVHLLAGHYRGNGSEVLALSAGVVVGAQAGAMLSARFGGSAIVLRLLSLALVAVAVRLLAGALL